MVWEVVIVLILALVACGLSALAGYFFGKERWWK